MRRCRILSLLAGLLLPACVNLPRESVLIDRVVLGQSVEGRAIEAVVITGESAHFGESDGRETLLVFGAIHGDETLTRPLVEELVEVVAADPEIAFGKRIFIVPVANPDGLMRRTRHNARGVDLNRNFPASNWKRGSRRHGPEPGSEPETRVLVDLVERIEPARVLSVHAPLHCIDHDGPAAGLARALGDASGYAVKKVGYPTPGSFGGWAGIDLEIPVITLELRRNIHREELWSELGPALLAFVRYPDV